MADGWRDERAPGIRPVIEQPPRALIVACNFPPDASVGTMRTLRLVRHLTASAWQVSVVTVAPRGFRPGTVVDPALVERVPSDVAVVRATPLRPFERMAASLKRSRPRASSSAAVGDTTSASASSPPAPASALTRMRRAVSAALAIPDRDASWLVPAIWRGWRHGAAHRPDVVYSSGPPFSAHIAAAALARLLRVPWVADFRDPWARAPWRDDRFAFERKAWAVLERFVVRHADAVVFVTDTNRRDFAREYGPAAARFSLVPNGCDLRDFDGLARRSPPDRERFVMLHAGSLYGARNPAALFRALVSAIAKGRIDGSSFRLRFIGRVGGLGLDLPALARELGLEAVVEFASHMPRRASLQEMLDASALLIVQPITTVSIPAKLY
jgi:glycosyltransferase involved in cell wall biosynthesis